MKVCGLSSRICCAADAAFRDQAAVLLRPRREIMHRGDDVGGHEADIVPLKRIFIARIAEADRELHGGSLAGAGSNRRRRASC